MSNGEASNSKKKITTIDDVLKGLVEWLCAQVCIHLGIGKVGLSHKKRSINMYA